MIARSDGEPAKAETLAHEALSAVGSMVLAAPDCLELLAGVAVDLESFQEAARLFGAADAYRARIGIARLAMYPATDGDIARARAALGDAAFDAACAEGAALELDDAIAYARRGRGDRKRPSTGWESLTPAEWQIVPLVAEHLTNVQIGERLFMSPKTVKTHLSHIFAKLGVKSRAELASQAIRRGLPDR
jgi:DNA-binding CsgD family transcriptional regulator